MRIRFSLFLAFLAIGSPALRAQDRVLYHNERLILGTDSARSASVSVGDINGDGHLDVAVANGRHWPDQNMLYLGSQRGIFRIAKPIGHDWRTSYSAELADLDGDGDLDIVTANDMVPGRIFLNDGQGNFGGGSEYGGRSSVRGLTVADVDSDDDMDLVVTSRGMPNQIYLNDGKANFHKGPLFGNQHDSTISVTVADLNRDGHADLLLANRDGQPNQVLLGDKELNFSKSLPFGSGRDQTRGIGVADFNADGNLDWALANIGQPNRICFGDGAGGVAESIEFGRRQGESYSLAIADMNRDGTPDIVIGNRGESNAVYILSFQGDSMQSMEHSFGSDTASTYGIRLGDLNGDSLPDVVVANSGDLNRVFINRFPNQQDRQP